MASMAIRLPCAPAPALFDSQGIRRPQLITGACSSFFDNRVSVVCRDLISDSGSAASKSFSRASRFCKKSGVGLEYEDMGHVEFYNVVRCGKKMKGEYKRLKALVKDSKRKLNVIAAASAIQADTAQEEVQSETAEALKSASEVFMGEVLQQLDEIKAQLKDLKVRANKNKCDSSSSSSSSSSESSSSDEGSGGKALKKALKRKARLSQKMAPVTQTVTSPNQIVPLVISANDFFSEINPSTVVENHEPALTKVEVCMGGKCRRNRANEILAALEEKADSGVPILPTACSKCMGKCKVAPNVKVREINGSSTMHNLASVNELNMILDHHIGSKNHAVPVHQ